MVTLKGISKRFGAIQALTDLSLQFESGEIHAVIGENGAGKSTLMKIIGGFVKPDAGSGILTGTPPVELPFGDPHLTRQRGIEMVHQHFVLVPEFTVIENLALSTLKSLTGALELPYERFTSLASTLGWELDLDSRTGSLPVGAQQRVEILKALAADSPILILDEPSAVLSESEVEDLFRVLRELRSRGKAIILIAHKLKEVLAVADRISVLREGRLIGTKTREQALESELKAWMLGSERHIDPTRLLTVVAPSDELVLNIKDCTVLGDRGERAVNGVSLSVGRGEVIGIGGVDGNGQLELAEALVGIRPCRATSRTITARVGYIPQDRQADGLALGMSIQENFLIKEHAPWVLSPKLVAENGQRLVRSYKIKAPSLEAPVSSLSGGNQQKVVVSRVLQEKPDLIIAMNPTRGLDFASTRFVHDALRLAASQGAGILLITTDRDEFAELATKSLFIDRGVVHDQGWVR